MSGGNQEAVTNIRFPSMPHSSTTSIIYPPSSPDPRLMQSLFKSSHFGAYYAPSVWMAIVVSIAVILIILIMSWFCRQVVASKATQAKASITKAADRLMGRGPRLTDTRPEAEGFNIAAPVVARHSQGLDSAIKALQAVNDRMTAIETVLNRQSIIMATIKPVEPGLTQATAEELPRVLAKGGERLSEVLTGTQFQSTDLHRQLQSQHPYQGHLLPSQWSNSTMTPRMSSRSLRTSSQMVRREKDPAREVDPRGSTPPPAHPRACPRNTCPESPAMQQAVQQAGTETGPDPSREGAKDMMKLYPMDQLLEMAGMVLAKSESMKDYSMKHSAPESEK